MGFRARLILSYAWVIVITLLMAVGLFLLIIQQIQQGERNKAEARLESLTREVGSIISRPLSRDLSDYRQQSDFYATMLNVRILLIDERGRVLVDTMKGDNNLVGSNLPTYNKVPADGKPYPGLITLGGVNFRYFALQGPTYREVNPTGDTNSTTPINLSTNFLLGVPEANLAFSLGDFIQLMLGAAALALALAIGLAYLVARTITRPITRMTRASEAIAQGDYNQRLEIKGKGNDEVGRLATSFNRMTVEVARSQQAMRDFVANVSHELKTPLTSIQGYSQAVLDGTADDRDSIYHSVQVISDEAARMRLLVDELLDLSRIEAGQAELRWSEVDLPSLLERVSLRLTPLANQKRVHLLADFAACGSQIPQVRGDRDRLEQVLTNIMDNAVKYSPENGVVRVELKVVKPQAATNGNGNHNGNGTNGHQLAQIAISNNGPLIPPEQRDRIFERFYKLDKSLVKKKGESTGLGLAIAKELVEAHGGKITVESGMVNVRKTEENYPFAIETQEALTTFTISLPLLALPQITSPQPAPLSSVQTPPASL